MISGDQLSDNHASHTNHKMPQWPRHNLRVFCQHGLCPEGLAELPQRVAIAHLNRQVFPIQDGFATIRDAFDVCEHVLGPKNVHFGHLATGPKIDILGCIQRIDAVYGDLLNREQGDSLVEFDGVHLQVFGLYGGFQVCYGYL